MATQWQHALEASKAIGSALRITVEERVISVEFGTLTEIGIGKHYSIRNSGNEFYPWAAHKVDKDGKEARLGIYCKWHTAVYKAYHELFDEIINGMISVELEAERLDA